MYTYFFREHLNQINKYQNAIIFYKGFPSQFLDRLNNHLEALNNVSDIGKGIDVFNLEQSARKLQTRLLSIDDGLYWATYEEFILLSNRFQNLHDNYNGIIVIVENNFFLDYYPIDFSTYLGPKLIAFMQYNDAEEDNKEPSEDVSLLLQYYGGIKTVGKTPYCSYVNKDEQHTNIVIISYFPDVPMLEKSELKQIQSDQIDFIFPYYINDDFYSVKEEFHYGQHEKYKIFNIMLEATVFREIYLYEEISIFAHVCRQLGITVNFSLNKPSFADHYRTDLMSILKRYWEPSAQFRELFFYEDPDSSLEKVKISQGTLIEDIVTQCEKAKADSNNYSDIFITAPTGSGKSVLFQIPAIYLSESYSWMTIIVTPLIALMNDQVIALRKRGVQSAFINSDLSIEQRDEVLKGIQNGVISILYLSPELLLSNDIRNIIGDREVGLMVVDEAHLITTWGRDFRVDYWFLGNYINKIRRYKTINPFPVLALTATAVYHGEDDMVLDTIDSLYMKSPKVYLGTVRRDEISFDFSPLKIDGSHEDQKIKKTIARIKELIDNNEKAICYFPWISQINDVLTNLEPQYKKFVGSYHGRMEASLKEELMLKFKLGKVKVMLATKAFGMGVDISDINIVYHHAPSGNLCDYVQEIGRVARAKSIKGKAKIDFHGNDLKYARILYGLSSMKQFQLNYMLQKTYEIYKMNNTRNFLVSPEAYGYIFSANSDLEQKVKNGLLLLEKDFIKKYGYPVLLVRPRSMFSKCYICVPKTIEEEFTSSKYYSYVKMVSDVRNNARTQHGENPITITDIGNIYEIDLKSVWEYHFENISFPQLKRAFFNRDLFSFSEPIYPRYRFSIELFDNPDRTKIQLDRNLDAITTSFETLAGGFFTKQELISILKKGIGNEEISRKVATVMLNMFVTDQNWGEHGRTYWNYDFIQKKTTDKGEEYRVTSRHFNRLKGQVSRVFNNLFNSSLNPHFIKYISFEDAKQCLEVKFAYLIEAMALGTYQLSGGKNPEIFIRINDPYKIRVTIQKGNYRNAILADIDRRQKKSVELMKQFFTQQYSDLERWDRLENYFLGRGF